MTSAALASPVIALLDMLGGSELLVIFLLVLIFFGGEKMPEFARGLGKAIREFRKAASGVEAEFKKALEEEPTQTHPPYSVPNHTILPPTPAQPAGSLSAPTNSPTPGATVPPAAQPEITPTPPSTPGATNPAPTVEPKPRLGNDVDAG